MSGFSDTSKWKRKNGTTLVYSDDVGGVIKERSSEMAPQTVEMQLERLSFQSITSWHVKDTSAFHTHKGGFFTNEFIIALGILDNCRLHAITLDENPNATSSRIDVKISPAPLEQLQGESIVHQHWSLFAHGEPPEEGRLKDEWGQINYYGAGEFQEYAVFSAHVLLSQKKFDAFAKAIKQGNIRSARLSLLADLYHLSYENIGAGLRGHHYNFAIVCNDEGTSEHLWETNGTKARVQELNLVWSPELNSKNAWGRDEPD